ncbi:MAG: hypothetical protein AMXMBFR33_22000 [Candidatus Xenobia bacterium]
MQHQRLEIARHERYRRQEDQFTVLVVDGVGDDRVAHVLCSPDKSVPGGSWAWEARPSPRAPRKENGAGKKEPLGNRRGETGRPRGKRGWRFQGTTLSSLMIGLAGFDQALRTSKYDSQR